MKRVSDKRQAQIPIENEVKRRIYDLGDGFCEYCHSQPIADRGHEIVFRGRGGSCVDPFNIIQLCQLHHDRQHNKIKKLPPIPVDVLAGIVREIRERQGWAIKDLEEAE